MDLAPHPFLPVQNLTIDDASAPFDAVPGQDQAEQAGAQADQPGPGKRR